MGSSPDDIEITVIGDSARDWTWKDRALTGAGITRVDEIYVHDVASMVNEVIKRCAARGGAKISRLNIIDHGNPQSFRIGTDWISEKTLSNFAALLSMLRSHFAPKGFIHIQNCQVGQNHALMLRIAAILGVPVYAGTGYHNPILRFNLGTYERCDPPPSNSLSGSCQSNVDRP